MVIDYRRLNNQTSKQMYPLPKIYDLLENFVRFKLFTMLNITHGYLQSLLSKETRGLTTLIASGEMGKLTEMVFDLSNASFYFLRIMDLTMEAFKGTVIGT